MCGVIGVIGPKEIPIDLYDALGFLQHRGQEGAGIVTFDQFHSDIQSGVYREKGLGLVNEVFNEEKLKQIESLEIMLQMTALNRGVCILPEWLADNKNVDGRFKKIRIGKNGLYQQLFLAMREPDKALAYIQKFISVGQKTANSSF